MVLRGVNLQVKDQAFWVSDATPSCDTQGVDTYMTHNTSSGFTAPFFFRHDVEMLRLCYRFNYQDESTAHALSVPTDYLLFPDVRVATLGPLSATPTGIALGCSANVSITGSGFAAASGVPARCHFGGYGSTSALYVSDTRMSCEAPEAALAGLTSLHLQFTDEADAPLLLVEAAFTLYDASLLAIDTAAPNAGPYDATTLVQLIGSFLDFGAPACRFGSFVSYSAQMADTTAASCSKPAFPASERDRLGAYPIYFSPDGQCWVSTSVNYTTHNAMVTSLSPTGAPSTSSVPLTVLGEGFVPLPSARCTFSAENSSEVRYTQLTVSSSTEAVCSTPAGGTVASYSVAVQLNGIDDEPYFVSAPSFVEYDLTSVTLTALSPMSGPKEEATTLTVDGAGFAAYGEDQLVCQVGSTAVTGRLLSATRILCELPPTLPNGTLAVSISLNGGMHGTFTKTLPFMVYLQPVILDVSLFNSTTRRRALNDKAMGSSVGGSQVLLDGSGFAVLPSNQRNVQCRFGERGSPTSPGVVLSDTQVLCTTTWGVESSDGQPVSVALNGVSFTEATDAIFFFVGTHPPQLTGTYFTTDGTMLIIQLDAQPTDRGRTNGDVRCDQFLSIQTATQLRGTAPEPAICGWSDDSTIRAYLTIHTSAEPGMTVALRENAIRPKYFHGLCTPGAIDNMCNDKVNVTVDAFFPCNVPSADGRQECSPPVAVLLAPTVISVCEGTTLELDGTHSYGGGVKPLRFTWTATDKSDNRRNILPYLDRARDQPCAPSADRTPVSSDVAPARNEQKGDRLGL